MTKLSEVKEFFIDKLINNWTVSKKDATADVEELFELAEIGEPIAISSLCTVFAESEVINYMGEGRSREDLAAGVIDSVALKVSTLVQRKELQDNIIITGGFSDNVFFAGLLGKKLGKKVNIY